MVEARLLAGAGPGNVLSQRARIRVHLQTAIYSLYHRRFPRLWVAAVGACGRGLLGVSGAGAVSVEGAQRSGGSSAE